MDKGFVQSNSPLDKEKCAAVNETPVAGFANASSPRKCTNPRSTTMVMSKAPAKKDSVKSASDIVYRGINRTKSDDTFGSGDWESDDDNAFFESVGGDSEGANGFLVDDGNFVMPKVSNVDVTDCDWFSGFDSEAADARGERRKSPKMPAGALGSVVDVKPADLLDDMPHLIDHEEEVRSRKNPARKSKSSSTNAESEPTSSSRSRDAEMDVSRRGERSSRHSNHSDKDNDMDVSRRGERSSRHSSHSDKDKGMDVSHRGCESSKHRSSRSNGDSDLGSSSHGDHRQFRSSSHTGRNDEMDRSRRGKKSSNGTKRHNSADDIDHEMDRSRPRSLEKQDRENRRGRRLTAGVENTGARRQSVGRRSHKESAERKVDRTDKASPMNGRGKHDEMDSSRRGQRSLHGTTVHRRGRQGSESGSSGLEELRSQSLKPSRRSHSHDDDMDRSRRGSRRRSVGAERSRSSTSSTDEEDEEHARSRSRSRSRRPSMRHGRKGQPSKSILGDTSDTDDSELDEVEAMFKQGKKEEQRAMLDKSRHGPVRALDRPHDEVGKFKDAYSKRSSLGYLPSTVTRDLPCIGSKSKSDRQVSLDDLFVSNANEKALSGSASVHGDAFTSSNKKIVVSSNASLPGEIKPTKEKKKECLHATTDNWTYAVDELLDARRLGRRSDIFRDDSSPKSHKAQLRAAAVSEHYANKVNHTKAEKSHPIPTTTVQDDANADITSPVILRKVHDKQSGYGWVSRVRRASIGVKL